MSPLRDALADYLAMRRALGYKLERDGKLLAQFLDYLDDRGESQISTDLAVAWATLPAGGGGWHSSRLQVARGFARYLHALDPTVEVPPAGLLPERPRRATPFLYSDEQIAALLAACDTLGTPHRAATYRTLFGLLAVTGMRVGEAIGLDRPDFHDGHGVLIVRHGKHGKSRGLPLNPSVVDAVGCYLHRSDRPCRASGEPALLVSGAGTRLLITNVQSTFRMLRDRAAIKPRSRSCQPRIHDLRHTFAVRTILDGYRQNADIGPRLALLSTYLGHVDPAKTYWYLEAAPELMQHAGERLERYLGAGS